MKYRLLDEETLGHMIDFLDDIQIAAAKGKSKDDMDKINMCSYLISEIINANEATELDDDEDIEDIKEGSGLYVDMPDIQDMDKKDWNKMIEQLDAFFAGWEKSNNKKKKRDSKKSKGKKSTTIIDTHTDEEEEEYIPTIHDKFEQYYLERQLKKQQKEMKSLDEILYNIGLDLPPEEIN
jgi:hypothetical protein